MFLRVSNHPVYEISSVSKSNTTRFADHFGKHVTTHQNDFSSSDGREITEVCEVSTDSYHLVNY